MNGTAAFLPVLEINHKHVHFDANGPTSCVIRTHAYSGTGHVFGSTLKTDIVVSCCCYTRCSISV